MRRVSVSERRGKGGVPGGCERVFRSSGFKNPRSRRVSFRGGTGEERNSTFRHFKASPFPVFRSTEQSKRRRFIPRHEHKLRECSRAKREQEVIGGKCISAGGPGARRVKHGRRSACFLFFALSARINARHRGLRALGFFEALKGTPTRVPYPLSSPLPRDDIVESRKSETATAIIR